VCLGYYVFTSTAAPTISTVNPVSVEDAAVLPLQEMGESLSFQLCSTSVFACCKILRIFHAL